MTVDELLAAADIDGFWLPPWARRVHRPELTYFASTTDEPHLNCGLSIQSDHPHLSQLLAEVDDAHAGHRARWKLAHTSRSSAVEAALHARGYAPAHEHLAFGLDPNGPRPAVADGITIEQVATLADLRAMYSVMSAAFGRPVSAAGIDGELAACTGPDRRVIRFLARDRDGVPLSTGALTLHPSLRFAFFWSGATIEQARGRGAYSAVVTARLHAAAAHGCTRVGVYARVESSAPILAKQGFVAHGPMTWWERPA